MRHFWQGFADKQASKVSFKKHVIVLYWQPSAEGKTLDAAVTAVKRLSFKYPSVKVKIVNVLKDPAKPTKHGVREFPTVLLLKDGREVDRVAAKTSPTLLEQLFRKAHV